MANKFLSTAPKIIAQIESPKLAVLITTKEVPRRLAVEDEDHVIQLFLIRGHNLHTITSENFADEGNGEDEYIADWILRPILGLDAC
jgi:hypothetical protein